MAYLLNYTKKIAERIQYYDSMVDFTDETHWYNPFYERPNFMVIWIDESIDEN